MGSKRGTRRFVCSGTRAVAARWISGHVPRGAHVAADPSTPRLQSLRVLPLQLPGPGRPFDPNRNLVRLRHEGIHLVVVTGAVTDRVLAARDRYPRESAFYDALATRTKRLYYLAPG